MSLCVADLIGLPGLPSTKMGIHKWLQRNNNALSEEKNHKRTDVFSVSSHAVPVKLQKIMKFLLKKVCYEALPQD